MVLTYKKNNIRCQLDEQKKFFKVLDRDQDRVWLFPGALCGMHLLKFIISYITVFWTGHMQPNSSQFIFFKSQFYKVKFHKFFILVYFEFGQSTCGPMSHLDTHPSFDIQNFTIPVYIISHSLFILMDKTNHLKLFRTLFHSIYGPSFFQFFFSVAP